MKIIIISFTILFSFFILLVALSIYKEKRAHELILKAKKEWLKRIGNSYYALCKPLYVHKCSLQVVSSAEKNPLEYVYKYFYKNANFCEKEQIITFARNGQESINKTYELALKVKRDIIEEFDLNNTIILGEKLSSIVDNNSYWHINPPEIPAFYFQYLSARGRSQKIFKVPVSPEVADYLLKKDNTQANAKKERLLMTNKLRRKILERDNYTCQLCGISLENEPHLLLEVDHIIPISKGGKTVESNLQTLCWKCNRSKSNKI